MSIPALMGKRPVHGSYARTHRKVKNLFHGCRGAYWMPLRSIFTLMTTSILLLRADLTISSATARVYLVSAVISLLQECIRRFAGILIRMPGRPSDSSRPSVSCDRSIHVLLCSGVNVNSFVRSRNKISWLRLHE